MMLPGPHLPPYYVATYSGFLVAEPDPEDGRVRVYMTADVRQATPFQTFDEADMAAKKATGWFFPGNLAYFAILCVPNGPIVTE